MKKLIIILLIITSGLYITTAFNSANNNIQSSFCEGWDDGYQEALDGCLKVGITPICPIAPIGKDTYKHGYGMGYAKATKKCEE